MMRGACSASDIRVYCAFDEIEDIEKCVPNPQNPNTHPDSQISLLAKIIKAQGWRAPITISTRSGFVVRGHGRLLAACHLGVTEVPVDYQDYETEADEYADLIADNRIAELAKPDRNLITKLIDEFYASGADPELFGYDPIHFSDPINQWLIQVDCKTEQEQLILLDELAGRGIKCMAVI